MKSMRVFYICTFRTLKATESTMINLKIIDAKTCKDKYLILLTLNLIYNINNILFYFSEPIVKYMSLVAGQDSVFNVLLVHEAEKYISITIYLNSPSPSSGDAYSDRQLTFEIMSPKFRNHVCLSVP